MTEKHIHERLRVDYPDIVSELYPYPKPYRGSGKIKAIILGADPTHIIKKLPPRPFNMVFELDNPKSSYFRSIKKNIDLVDGLSMDNVFVQNLCRNYFTKETSQNKDWVKMARHYWANFLAHELNNTFPASVPVLMTTEFILGACLRSGKAEKAEKIYSQCLCIAGEDNLLGREMIALYRHHRYSLNKWDDYMKFITERIKSV